MSVRNKEESSTRSMRLSFNKGPRYDESPETVPVMDSNNVVLSPDGSECRAIPGSIITNTYRAITSPPGRKAIIVESAPHEVDLGRMFLLNNTANGDNVIEQIEFVRNSGIQVGSDEATNMIWTLHIGSYSTTQFEMEAYLPENSGFTGAETIGMRTVNGTALAGTHYTAADNPAASIVTGGIGAQLFVNLLVTSPDPGTPWKYFYVELYNPSSGTALGPYSKVTLTINN